jgi:hypothetical protein
VNIPAPPDERRGTRVQMSYVAHRAHDIQEILLAGSGAWDPLGEYPEQSVTSRVAGVEGPAVRLAQIVHMNVTATKENLADDDVEVYGETWWRRVEPGGLIIPGITGWGFRKPGVQSFTFENQLPEDALEDADRRLRRSRRDQVLWRFTGREVPYDDRGRTGKPRHWQTEAFAIVR